MSMSASVCARPHNEGEVPWPKTPAKKAVVVPPPPPPQQQSIIGERECVCVYTHTDADTDTDPHQQNPSSARANMHFPPPGQAVSAHMNGLNNFALAVEVNDG